MLTLTCFKSYQAWIATAGEKTALLFPQVYQEAVDQDNAKDGEKVHKCIMISLKLDDIKGKAISQSLKVAGYLEAEIFEVLDAHSKLAMYVNHALLYLELVASIEGLSYDKPEEASEGLPEIETLKSKAKECLEEAQRMLGGRDALRVIVDEKLEALKPALPRNTI